MIVFGSSTTNEPGTQTWNLESETWNLKSETRKSNSNLDSGPPLDSSGTMRWRPSAPHPTYHSPGSLRDPAPYHLAGLSIFKIQRLLRGLAPFESTIPFNLLVPVLEHFLGLFRRHLTRMVLTCSLSSAFLALSCRPFKPALATPSH